MTTLAFLRDLTAAPLRKISFLPERCLRKRLSSCGCRRCSDTCPAGAILISDNRVQFDLDTCTDCMLCSVSCPNDAFEFEGPKLEKGLNTLPVQGDIVISCTRQAQINHDEYVLPCIGALSLEHLLVLGMGRSVKIIFNLSACPSCENRTAADHFCCLLSILQNNGAGQIKAELMTVTEHEKHFSIGSESRRAFLASLKNNLVSAIVPQIPANIGSSEAETQHSRRIPKRVQMVGNMLKNMDQEQVEFVSSLCLHDIRISNACTACPLCKGICPTGAIRINRSGENKSLAIDNTLCSGCGLCVAFCRHGAMELQKPAGRNTDSRIQGGDQTLPLKERISVETG